MGTGGNFVDQLDLYVDPETKQTSVVATGPSYGDGVVEMCIWIVQKNEGSASDAAATQITTYPGKGGLTEPTVDGTLMWKLRALQTSTNPLVPGPATAMAIALFRDEDGEEQARFWAQSVDLVKKP
jgi:hypothetical protein